MKRILVVGACPSRVLTSELLAEGYAPTAAIFMKTTLEEMARAGHYSAALVLDKPMDVETKAEALHGMAISGGDRIRFPLPVICVDNHAPKVMMVQGLVLTPPDTQSIMVGLEIAVASWNEAGRAARRKNRLLWRTEFAVSE